MVVASRDWNIMGGVVDGICQWRQGEEMNLHVGNKEVILKYKLEVVHVGEG